MDESGKRIHPRVAEVVAGPDRAIMASFGMTVVQAADGCCEMAALVTRELINASGFGHGGIAFSIMDTACAYALSSTEVRGVTVNANVTYVKGVVAGSQLFGRAEIASRTRRVATLRGEVSLATENGLELAAHGTFVFQLIEPRN